MNKKFIYYFLIVVVIGLLPKTTQVIRGYFAENKAPLSCTLEVNICQDGSSVSRIMPTCEFAACPTPLKASTTTLAVEVEQTTPLSTTTKTIESVIPVPSEKPITEVIPKQEISTAKNTSIISKITEAVSSVVSKVTSSFTVTPPPPNAVNDAVIPPSTYITSSSSPTTNSVYKALPPTEFAGQKYLVQDNNILSNDNKVIYTIPPEVIAAVSSSNAGWTNTTINVVPVGNEPPIINGVPVKDLPGKYYLSENSFGNIEACEFSNKIFILDIYTNEVTLMYEENSSTLAHDDPRACNSEIFLLATDGDKLALKYHTIGTNTLCDSMWSEPDKTFYLDVKKLTTQGMMRYTIPESLSITAEQEEEACRAKL